MFFAPSWFFFILRVQFLGYTPQPLPSPWKTNTKKKNKKKNKKNQLDLPIANKIHLICPRDAGTWPGRHVNWEFELVKCYTQL